MKLKRIFTILITSILLFTVISCVSSTNVTFNTDTPNAEIYVDGNLIGKTPVTTELSNAIWEDPTITIKKEGYRTLNSSVQKELKAVNVVFGIFLNPPAFLWCYGPKQFQNFSLVPENE